MYYRDETKVVDKNSVLIETQTYSLKYSAASDRRTIFFAKMARRIEENTNMFAKIIFRVMIK